MLPLSLRLRVPLIVAPMAGGPSSPDLVAAASKAGALGSIGAAYSSPAAIEDFAAAVRRQTDQPFAINLFAPHPVPTVTPFLIHRDTAKSWDCRRHRSRRPTKRISIGCPYFFTGAPMSGTLNILRDQKASSGGHPKRGVRISKT
jgi:NAD(P)H-dependent flavin oxidoreductase YrpB (nitropropane dioxygenase family)